MIAKALTRQQRRILVLVRDGETLRAISQTLNIKQHTAVNHSRNIKGRLSACSLTHAVVIAIRCGFIPLKGGEKIGEIKRKC